MASALPSSSPTQQPELLQKRVRRLAGVTLIFAVFNIITHFNILSLLWGVFVLIAYRSTTARPNVKVLKWFSCLNCCAAVLGFIAFVAALVFAVPLVGCACDEACVDGAFAWAQERSAWVVNHSSTLEAPGWADAALNKSSGVLGRLLMVEVPTTPPLPAAQGFLPPPPPPTLPLPHGGSFWTIQIFRPAFHRLHHTILGNEHGAGCPYREHEEEREEEEEPTDPEAEQPSPVLRNHKIVRWTDGEGNLRGIAVSTVSRVAPAPEPAARLAATRWGRDHPSRKDGEGEEEEEEEEEFRRKYGGMLGGSQRDKMMEEEGRRQRHHRSGGRYEDEDDDEDEEGGPEDASPAVAMLVRLAHGFQNITLDEFEDRAERVCNSGRPLVAVGSILLLLNILFHAIVWSSARKLSRHPWMIEADRRRREEIRTRRAALASSGGFLPPANGGNGQLGVVPVAANHGEVLYRFVPGLGFVAVTESVQQQQQQAPPAPSAPRPSMSDPSPPESHAVAAASSSSATAANHNSNNNIIYRGEASVFEDLSDAFRSAAAPVTGFVSRVFGGRRGGRNGYAPVQAADGPSSSSSVGEYEMTRVPYRDEVVGVPHPTSPHVMATAPAAVAVVAAAPPTAAPTALPVVLVPSAGATPVIGMVQPQQLTQVHPGSAGSYGGY